jgi:catechol 2,3-dioxygenase-like lactoylglutathione lyase family enzyme
MMAAMRGVHHVGITVPDLERAIDFYTGVLGLEFVDAPTPLFTGPEVGKGLGVPGAAMRQVNLRLGDVMVEVIEYAEPATPLEDRPIPVNARGAAHLGFLVDDIRAKKAELEAAEVEFLSEVNVEDEGILAGWRWVYFRDPFGIVFELVEIAYRDGEAAEREIAEYLARRESKGE